MLPLKPKRRLPFFPFPFALSFSPYSLYAQKPAPGAHNPNNPLHIAVFIFRSFSAPQKVNREPNWNCRGEFTVDWINPKSFGTVKLGTEGIPNWA